MTFYILKHKDHGSQYRGYRDKIFYYKEFTDILYAKEFKALNKLNEYDIYEVIVSREERFII